MLLLVGILKNWKMLFGREGRGTYADVDVDGIWRRYIS